MKETRRLKIENKVFTKSSFLNIGNLFVEEYEASLANDERASLEFRASCSDGTSYESESIELFDDGGILDLKKTNSLEMTLHNYASNQYMNLSVVHGGSYGDQLIVRGTDRAWVNGTFTRVKEVLDALKPQENFVLNHRTALFHVAAFGIGIPIYYALWFLIFRHIQPTKNPSEAISALRSFFANRSSARLLLDWFFFWLFGAPWAFEARAWLLSLWPSIEFDFGPEHLKTEKLKRQRVISFCVIMIIPIVLAGAYDLLKLL